MNKERRKRIAEALGKISEAKDILEEVKDEEQDAYDKNRYSQRGKFLYIT